MWICPICFQQFIKQNQLHSCNERTVDDFLMGKSEHTLSLFYFFIERYQELGSFVLHPAKSRIAFAAQIRFGYIHRLGKDFLDVVLTFNQPHDDNLCFYRIGAMPEGKIFQHYLRLYCKDDLNKEVLRFMKMAVIEGNR